MQRFRKREPIEVEAVHVTTENIDEIVEWCHGKLIYSGHIGDYDGDDDEVILVEKIGVKLLTKQRLQVALIGDYIYLDQDDFFHVAKLSDFLFEYEPIKEKDL